MNRGVIIFLLFLAGLAGSPPPMAAAQAEEIPPLGTLDAEPAGDTEATFLAIRKAIATAATEQEKLHALAALVNMHRRRGDYAEGLTACAGGLERARRLGDLRLQIEFLYLEGRLYWNLTEYPQSLERHLEELKLATQLGDPAFLARTHGGLGLTYLRYGQAADALRHLLSGLALVRQTSDERMRGSLLNSLGNYYLAQNDLAAATETFAEALHIRERFGNARAIAETVTNLGLVAEARGDPATALSFLERALHSFETLKYRRYIANTQRSMAVVLRRMGRLDDALRHLGTALQVANTLKSPEVVANIQRELAVTYEAQGDFAAALLAQRQLAVAIESMRGEQDRRRMDELRSRYKAEQRELEIALLKRDQELQAAEITRRRSQSFALAGGLAAIVAILGSVILVQVVRIRGERRLRAATEHARGKAEAAERLKTRLLQIASHDLKVPLAALNTTAARIGEEAANPPVVRRLATGIQVDTARMRRLVHDFLDASAIEEGHLQLHTTEVDLGRVAGAAVAGLQPVAAAKRQSLAFIPAPGLSAVEADAERLRQVLDNLISNALKFTPAGGKVEVMMGETGPWAFAEVRDSGPGLGPEDFARIFSPFQRLTAQPTGREDSTGLGLFIARELLTQQGGRLDVQSQLGRGAVFRVLLPLARALAD